MTVIFTYGNAVTDVQGGAAVGVRFFHNLSAQTPIAREIAGTHKPHVASFLKSHPPRLLGPSQE
jgi:hypothetical protein